jgi:hypothetical protein
MLALRGIGESGTQPPLHGLVGQRKESRPVTAGNVRELLEVAIGHLAAAHPASIGAPARDRGEQRGVGRVAGARTDRHRRDVAGILRIGQPVDVGGVAGGGERDQQVMQGCSAAEDEVPAIRVGRHELPLPVRVQLHGAAAEAPTPGLCVVHRWGAHRALHRRRQVYGLPHRLPPNAGRLGQHRPSTVRKPRGMWSSRSGPFAMRSPAESNHRKVGTCSAERCRSVMIGSFASGTRPRDPARWRSLLVVQRSP